MKLCRFARDFLVLLKTPFDQMLQSDYVLIRLKSM